ncbi:CubicO group peptidase, beta-lactamase class C family [Pseudobutyrivibrio sp. OR37]|uniref:serine hydrolase domain-containing protein n=1 Tax=Pseudobutyrivibrio sp. OR37 TaxID=1798186 RepID=UPI0008F06D6F|nr:serine hydrolase domain-containing protein [Pseudobutyrivibrio sp. OR37]SFI05722.1 CubicO group peptidase, beta-lactamase class C family [Pseudobutyrivibrio sp. OR37]
MKQSKIILRRILLIIMIITAVIFFVLHYDSKEYSLQNEQEYINKISRMTHNRAVAVGIMDGDENIYLEYCDIAGKSVDEHTLFELGSTTKAFTGLGILNLQKEGVIKLDSPVTDYIDWFKPQYKGRDAVVTVRHLMNHSSGIPVWTISLIPEGSEGEITLEDTVRKIADVKLSHAPGEVHEYATINYDVLALIIENVTGQKYEDYITETVLKDVGMNESFFRTSDSDRQRIFTGRKASFFGMWQYDAPTYYGNTAAGYLVSDTNDLVTWMRYVRGKIDFNSFQITDANNYYAGWNLHPETVHHGGNNPNYSTQIIISRERDLGVFVLSASAGDIATRIADGIYGMHMGVNARIGLCVSGHELQDFLFVMGILLTLYIALLLDYRKKKLCLYGGIMVLIVLILIPVISRISYRFMFVWMPYSFSVMIISILAFAIWLIARGREEK